MAEISFLGLNGIKIKTKNLVVVVDPPTAKERADVVVYLSQLKNDLVGGGNREKPFLIENEGEYELGGVSLVIEKHVVENNQSFRLAMVRVDGASILDLSQLMGELTEKQIEKYAEVGIVLAPFGVLNKLVDSLMPSIAIPVGFEKKEEVEQYLSSNKFDVVKKDLDKLKVEGDSLPENTEVVVLNA